ncbi:MAG: cation:proton antiporter [Magnetococcales bacterium]|nr:cation:proton antiporter [Magnetococcales bacterium]
MALLNDLMVIFALAVAVSYLCGLVRIPVILGFLLTGTLVGPHGFALAGSVHAIEELAEVGVMLLLFVIGMEISLEQMARMRRVVALGGGLQLGLTIAATAALASPIFPGWGSPLFVGFLAAMSSTAIVLKLLQERAEMASPQGQATLGVLIFQDVMIVPMILLTPLLAGGGGAAESSGLEQAARVVGVMAMLAALTQLVPRLLLRITRTRSRELFLLSIILLCLFVAWSTAKAGLSLALGAFLAGVIIGRSEYSHQAVGDVLPFRDVFLSLFFVSVGMLLDVRYLLDHLGLAMALTLGLAAMKWLTASGALLLAGAPLKAALLSGAALAQIGEFSFVLSKTGMDLGLFPREYYQPFLAVSILSMAAAPFMIRFAPAAVEGVLRRPALQQWVRRRLEAESAADADSLQQAPLRDHLIIVGYGAVGRITETAARSAGVVTVVLEMNPETVRRERRAGVNIRFGDAAQEPVLEEAGLHHARVLLVAIPDAASSLRVVETARRLNPVLHIVARTHWAQEADELLRLGANEVIHADYEAAMEILAKVLAHYHRPLDEIEGLTGRLRSRGYALLRHADDAPSFPEIADPFSELVIGTLRLKHDSQAARLTLAESALRSEHGLTVLAIHRQGVTLAHPDGGALLEPEDLLLVLGRPEDVAKTSLWFAPPDAPRPDVGEPSS